MSDLSLQLQQAASQLPVSTYFDEALLQRELETIFQRGPRYVGHVNWCPTWATTMLCPKKAKAAPWYAPPTA
jgi:choline monooxygenase